MHKTNCMQSIKIFQCGKSLVAYVLNVEKYRLLTQVKSNSDVFFVK